MDIFGCLCVSRTVKFALWQKRKFLSKKKPVRRAGTFYGVRCTDEDAATFERIAKLEGFSTVTQWMLVNSRRRARAIALAADKGESINISEVVVVPIEG